jgi:hypothetical protein
LLAGIHEDSDFFTQVEAMREIAGLCAVELARLPSGKGSNGYISARKAMQTRDYESAMDGVIGSLEESGSYAEGAAAKLGKALVKLLGIRHPVIDERHRRFSSLLYA